MKRIIYHVDVNSAFLSWEAVYRLHHLGGKLDLRTIPSAVGGDQEKRHGIILAKSIPAKSYHIHTGETVIDARRKCPELLLVPPNYDLYNRSSRALIQILGRYTDKIEQYSIDEAFLDMTGCTHRPEQTAAEIKDTVRRELGFTVNVGVSVNKLLAKMASELKKPDLVHTIWPEEIEEKMWPLPVEELFYVGHASRKKLNGLGIHTIGELARLEDSVLRAHMKSHGLLIKQYANGIDASAVVAEPPANKGYGNSLTTPRDILEPELAKLFLLSLAETVSSRLRADQVKIGVVAVSIRDYNLDFYSRQKTLITATDLTREIYEAACQCFDELWNGIPIRRLGVHTSQVTRESCRQISLFETVDYEKLKKAELAVDKLRKRYGIDCIKRASFLKSPSAAEMTSAVSTSGVAYPLTGGMFIDHMGGGVSREKRSVNYQNEIIL